MTRASHALSADGNLVLTVTEAGRGPRTFTLTAPDARRLAWAVLADLDPREAMLAADEELYENPLAFENRRPLGRNRVRQVSGSHPVQGARSGTISNRILKTLAAGAATSKSLGAAVNRPVSSVSAICCGLVAAGLTARDVQGGVAIWRLTDLGHRRAAA